MSDTELTLYGLAQGRHVDDLTDEELLSELFGHPYGSRAFHAAFEAWSTPRELDALETVERMAR